MPHTQLQIFPTVESCGKLFLFSFGWVANLFFEPENRLTSLRGKMKVIIEPCVAECYGLGKKTVTEAPGVSKKTITEARVQEWKMGRLYIYPGSDPVSCLCLSLLTYPFVSCRMMPTRVCPSSTGRLSKGLSQHSSVGLVLLLRPTRTCFKSRSTTVRSLLSHHLW